MGTKKTISIVHVYVRHFFSKLSPSPTKPQFWLVISLWIPIKFCINPYESLLWTAGYQGRSPIWWNGLKWDLQTWTINRYTYGCWTFPMSDLDGYGLKFKAQQKPEMDGSFWDFTWFYLSSFRSLIHPHMAVDGQYGQHFPICIQEPLYTTLKNRMPKLRLGLGLNLPTQPGPQQNTSDLGEVGFQVAQKSLPVVKKRGYNGVYPKIQLLIVIFRMRNWHL